MTQHAIDLEGLITEHKQLNDLHPCPTYERTARAMEAYRDLQDKLPRYADTGEVFVPGVDECFVAHSRFGMSATPTWSIYAKAWESFAGPPFYSTQDAAKAAAFAKAVIGEPK